MDPLISNDEKNDGRGFRSKRAMSVYALSPDPTWTQQTYTYPIWGLLMLGMFLLCLFTPPLPTVVFRAIYTPVAVGLLAWRVQYYYKKDWLVYFIDLCFVNGIAVVVHLWACRDGQCSPAWNVALYMVSMGPVPGGTFPLQLPLTLHHPEGFEAFFLHASVGWVVYVLRWQLRVPEMVPADGVMPSILELVKTGYVHYYLIWAFFYWCFLLIQPHLPKAVAQMETLMDGFIFADDNTPEKRLSGKRGKYFGYAVKVTMMLCVHAVLSGTGMLAAAMTYQYQALAQVWITLVLVAGVEGGARFYYASAHPEYEMPGLPWGFARMGLAWAVLLPAYAYCANFFG